MRLLARTAVWTGSICLAPPGWLRCPAGERGRRLPVRRAALASGGERRSPRRLRAAQPHPAGAALARGEGAPGQAGSPPLQPRRARSGGAGERGAALDPRAGEQLRRHGPGLHRTRRGLHGQLGAAGYERRRGPEPLRADRQQRLRSLQQGGHGALRTGADQYAVERLRRRLPDQQRRRSGGALRSDGRPVGHLAVLGQHHALPAVRGGVHHARSDGLVRALLLPVRQLSRLPEDGRLARRVLRDVQPVQRRGHHVPRDADLRLRPDEDARRPGGDAAVLHHQQRVRRPAAVRPRRRPPSACRRAGLDRRPGFRREPARLLAVPRGLRHAGEQHPHRPEHARDRRVLRSVQRRNLHSAVRHRAAARLARRPRDVPPRLPKPGRPRGDGAEPQRHRRDLHGRPLVRAAPERRVALHLPAGHVCARRELPLDGLGGDGPGREPRAGVQRLVGVAPSGDPLHGPARGRCAGPDDPGRGNHRRRRRVADGIEPVALGRLLDARGRPRRRLHVLVHDRVHPGERRVQLEDAHRLVQI